MELHAPLSIGFNMLLVLVYMGYKIPFHKYAVCNLQCEVVMASICCLCSATHCNDNNTKTQKCCLCNLYFQSHTLCDVYITCCTFSIIYYYEIEMNVSTHLCIVKGYLKYASSSDRIHTMPFVL